MMDFEMLWLLLGKMVLAFKYMDHGAFVSIKSVSSLVYVHVHQFESSSPLYFIMHYSFVTSLLAGASLVLGSPIEKRAEYAMDFNAPPGGDVTILNYALTLEYLERKFYQEGLANYTQAQFIAAGFPDPFYKNLKEIYYDEQVRLPPSIFQHILTDPDPRILPLRRPHRRQSPTRHRSQIQLPLHRRKILRHPRLRP
jgi:hypothetical protein